jgi:hypothetical protein
MHKLLKVLMVSLFSLSYGHAIARGAPVSMQTSKEFKNFIIQGERPEIAACMAATAITIKKSKQLKSLDWLEASSEAALMQEKDIGNNLVRKITLKAKGIINTSSFLDTLVDIQIECEQVNQGDPMVRITLSQKDN